MYKPQRKKYGTLVFIGRFQPFHVAHLEIVKRAIDLARQIVIITGSANQPRTYKNPFTCGERKLMIKNAIGDLCTRSFVELFIESNIDTVYNDQAWSSRIQKIVSKYKAPTSILAHNKIGIIGHKKDDSSRYLDFFPQWEYEDVGEIDPLSAVNIRDLYFKRNVNMNFIRAVVPNTTYDFLDQFRNTPDYEQIICEREFIEKYKKQYASLPYAPTFVTTDAVVVQSGHVLMIKRRSEPGKNLWALPGGYLNANTDKSLEDAMIRELREETGIKVPDPVLRGSIIQSKVFDAIDRDPRGRVITHAYHIALSDSPAGTLPKVKGMDDAAKAKWIALSEISSENCYSDHFDIIKDMTGI